MAASEVPGPAHVHTPPRRASCAEPALGAVVPSAVSSASRLLRWAADAGCLPVLMMAPLGV